MVSDIRAEDAAETAELIRAAGGTAESMAADASKEAVAEEMVAKVVELSGSLDFAHNNAGIGAPNSEFTEQTGEQWQRIFDVNVFGTMFFMKHELRQMYAQGHGAILNTASLASQSGNPGLSAYTATKWAVAGMTKVAAAEAAAKGVRVNALGPGATMTAALRGWKESSPEAFQAVADSIPMRRVSEPEEQAEPAVFLCSDAASYITGVTLFVDGGNGILGR